MNQTIQEAAEAACLRHSEHHYPESSTIKGPDWEMRKGFCESNFRDGFIAGAEWAQPKWIPVNSEQKPDNMQKVMILIRNMFSGENEISTVRYVSSTGFTKTVVLAWCAIPDSLLNFKP